MTFPSNGRRARRILWIALVAASLPGLVAASSLWGQMRWDQDVWYLAPDSDGDGLDDDFEVANGLDPFDADTDGDGIEDGAEVASGRNPRVNEGAIIPAILNLILGDDSE